MTWKRLSPLQKEINRLERMERARVKRQALEQFHLDKIRSWQEEMDREEIGVADYSHIFLEPAWCHAGLRAPALATWGQDFTEPGWRCPDPDCRMLLDAPLSIRGER